MSFDDALSALLALVGRPVEVHVFSAGESPHLVATFGGVLQAGHSMTGGEPSENEAIYIRIEAGRGDPVRSASIARSTGARSGTRTAR